MTARFEPLAPDLVTRIIADAIEVLGRYGVAVHHANALRLLGDHGARIDPSTARAFLPPDLVEKARGTAPASVPLFDSAGRQTHDVGGGSQSLAPGSSATLVLDRTTGEARPPDTADYVAYVQVVDGLPELAAQSTAFIPRDVPAAISDSYRLYLSLMYSAKPVFTGTFSAAGLATMTDLLATVRGGPEPLARAPLAVFSCCPISPLGWGQEAAGTLLDCARAGIPVELVPMALSGFIAPVSLAGTLVQHTAESLAGLVLSQLASPGAPVLFGGASTMFDIRFETTPMASVESLLMACGVAQIGRHLGLPTQAYIALSDAKQLDAQAGLETAMGAAAAALAGIDQVAGPGMLDFGNCFSVEKLVVDAAACAMAGRLRGGIHPPASPPLDTIGELLHEGHLLIAGDTRRHLREELSFPSRVIDRASRHRWTAEGKRPLAARTASEIEALLARYTPPPLDPQVCGALTERMACAARTQGMEALPRSCAR